VKLLGAVESVFSISSRGTVLATIRRSEEAVRVGDRIQLRCPNGTHIDSEILAIELIKKTEGRCQEAYMIPGHLPETRMPIGTEIWLL